MLYSILPEGLLLIGSAKSDVSIINRSMSRMFGGLSSADSTIDSLFALQNSLSAECPQPGEEFAVSDYQQILMNSQRNIFAKPIVYTQRNINNAFTQSVSYLNGKTL